MKAIYQLPVGHTMLWLCVVLWRLLGYPAMVLGLLPVHGWPLQPWPRWLAGVVCALQLLFFVSMDVMLLQVMPTSSLYWAWVCSLVWLGQTSIVRYSTACTKQRSTTTQSRVASCEELCTRRLKYFCSDVYYSSVVRPLNSSIMLASL